MMSSSCCRLSLTTGSAGNAETRRRIASSTGTLAAGSSTLNPVIACSVKRAISAPPGTRLHVVSTPSRRSRVAGSPPSSRKVSILGPPVTARGPTPNPCVLCMARLRAAIEANDSPDTGSSPPTSSFNGADLAASAGAGSRPAGADVVKDASRLPRRQLTELFGKCLGVAGELEGFDGEDDGCGVMAVCGARLRSEPRHDHVRTERADHADDVGEDGLPVPDPQRLLVVLRIPEVFRAREILPPPIQAPGHEQLLGAGHTQLLAELGTEQILAAVAAREREIGRTVSTTARQVGDGLRVLIVRMRRDVEHAAQRGEAAQLLADGGTGREIGGVAHPGAAGQHACHEGAPPRHPADSSDRQLRAALRGGTSPLRRTYTTRLP